MDANLRQLLDAEEKTGNLEAWIEYSGDDGLPSGFAVKLRHVAADELRRYFDRKSKRKRGELSLADQADFWLRHVLDWRGLEDVDGTPIEFTMRRAQRLFDLSGDFSGFVIREAQILDNFLDRRAAAPSGGVAADSQPEGSPEDPGVQG